RQWHILTANVLHADGTIIQPDYMPRKRGIRQQAEDRSVAVYNKLRRHIERASPRDGCSRGRQHRRLKNIVGFFDAWHSRPVQYNDLGLVAGYLLFAHLPLLKIRQGEGLSLLNKVQRILENPKGRP